MERDPNWEGGGGEADMMAETFYSSDRIEALEAIAKAAKTFSDIFPRHGIIHTESRAALREIITAYESKWGPL